MEGYREPSPKPPEPQLELCEKHGLHFDPALHHGCTVCRRDKLTPQPEDKRRRPPLAVAIVAFVAIAGATTVDLYQRHVRKEHTARLGQACTQQYGCTENADCVRPFGVCYRRCEAAVDCNVDEACQTGHCFPRVATGQECARADVCEDGVECVALADHPAMCLPKCESGGAVCPTGMTCTSVGDSAMPSFRRSYCVPF